MLTAVKLSGLKCLVLTRILSFLVFLDEMLRTEGMTTIGEGGGPLASRRSLSHNIATTLHFNPEMERES